MSGTQMVSLVEWMGDDAEFLNWTLTDLTGWAGQFIASAQIARYTGEHIFVKSRYGYLTTACGSSTARTSDCENLGRALMTTPRRKLCVKCVRELKLDLHVTAVRLVCAVWELRDRPVWDRQPGGGVMARDIGGFSAPIRRLCRRRTEQLFADVDRRPLDDAVAVAVRAAVGEADSTEVAERLVVEAVAALTVNDAARIAASDRDGHVDGLAAILTNDPTGWGFRTRTAKDAAEEIAATWAEHAMDPEATLVKVAGRYPLRTAEQLATLPEIERRPGTSLRDHIQFCYDAHLADVCDAIGRLTGDVAATLATIDPSTTVTLHLRDRNVFDEVVPQPVQALWAPVPGENRRLEWTAPLPVAANAMRNSRLTMKTLNVHGPERDRTAWELWNPYQEGETFETLTETLRIADHLDAPTT